jgi:enoyl-CoA hydratase/carnithine racemase
VAADIDPTPPEPSSPEVAAIMTAAPHDAADAPVLYAVDDAIATLTINLPKQRNPISEPPVVEGLLAALDRASADERVKVAILTGAGSAFSAGGDVKLMADAADERRREPLRTVDYYTRGIQRIPLAMARFDLPIIAAVNGPAVGAGCDLANMCDIRIAGESARFAESFSRLGLIAGDAGGWLLQRTVGFSKAAEMAFTGEMLDAKAALACGLVSEVVPDAELMSAARRLAARMTANPRDALRMTKRLLWQAREGSLAHHLEMAAYMQAHAHATADHREAIAAFLEKRPPKFGQG